MTRKLMLVVVLTFFVAEASGRVRAVRHPSALPMPNSVLWIAAHPDDEAVAAPLLAQWCLEDAARCGFLVLTRGEAGPCLDPGGCMPDVASTRSAEAGAASELFHADSILLRYPDGGGVLPPQWSEVSGDRPALVARIAAQIESFGPELVLTFDPRHGTTCHPDHRETGRLVLEAVQLLESRPSVWLLETSVTFATGGPQFGVAIPGALRFDATQRLASGEEAWSAVIRDMERHPSQFTPEFVQAVRNVPQDQRAVYIAPAETALQQPVAVCH
jgi:LmbE family N-acetylglucosaminyl deacetylase